MADNEGSGTGSAVFGRSPAPRVPLPPKGVVVGLAWSGLEGAGNQIVAARIELARGKAKLKQVWRPFQDAPGRRDVLKQFPAWLAEEVRWSEGRIVVGVDFPLSLAETHLRQLGLLRQAIRGPAALGKGLEHRYLPQGRDFTAGADAFKDELGKDRLRLADCYRATPHPPSHAKLFKATFFGLVTLAQVEELAFVPWDPPKAGQPALVEVRPEHVARVLAGACAYRDDPRDGVQRSSARAALLRIARTACGVEFDMETAAKVVEDEKGFMLDAVLSAVAAAAAQHSGFEGVPHNVPRSEGWIYSVREEPWRDG
jgi:hypothetical protein